MSKRVPRIRRAPLPADAVVVIRGDDRIDGSPRPQAEAFRRRYPDWRRWGLSGFYARNESDIEDLAADQLERFPVLLLYRPSTLEEQDLMIVPTFRRPHVTISFTGDLGVGLSKLRSADHEERRNPYHEEG